MVVPTRVEMWPRRMSTRRSKVGVENNIFQRLGCLLELEWVMASTTLFFQEASLTVPYGFIGEPDGVLARIWPSESRNREARACERLPVSRAEGTIASRCRGTFPGDTGHLCDHSEDPVPLRRSIGAGGSRLREVRRNHL